MKIRLALTLSITGRRTDDAEDVSVDMVGRDRDISRAGYSVGFTSTDEEEDHREQRRRVL